MSEEIFCAPSIAGAFVGGPAVVMGSVTVSPPGATARAFAICEGLGQVGNAIVKALTLPSRTIALSVYIRSTAHLLASRATALTLVERPGPEWHRLLALEDGAGDWLFEDGSGIGEHAGGLNLGARELGLSLRERDGEE